MLKKIIIPSIVGLTTVGALSGILLFRTNASEVMSATFDYKGFETTVTLSETDINIHGKGKGISKDDFSENKEIAVFMKDGSEITDIVLSNEMVDGNEDMSSFEYNYFFGLDEHEKPLSTDISQIDYIVFDGVKIDVQ